MLTSAMTTVLAAAGGAGGAGEDMTIHAWEWIVLAVIILGLITFDIVGHVRTPHEPTLKEATWWSIGYIAIALIFGLYVWAVHGPTYGGEYYAGWVTEKALSVDNLFVFVIIIAAFKVPRKYQQKALLYGIVIALVMRLVFILIGAAIIERFVAVFFLFGAFLIWTAIQQARQGVEDPDEQEEYHENKFVTWVRKRFPVTEGFVADKLLHRHSGKTYMTPMFLVILALGSADLMFAIDSIPAVYGLTSQPYLVFACNAFSLLGLRQLYFLIDGLLDRLIYLHYGLAAILGFIGVKLVIHAINGTVLADAPASEHIYEPTIVVSLGFIVGVLVVTVLASLLSPRGKEAARRAKEKSAAAEQRKRAGVTGEQSDAAHTTAPSPGQVATSESAEHAEAEVAEGKPVDPTGPGDDLRR